MLLRDDTGDFLGGSYTKIKKQKQNQNNQPKNKTPPQNKPDPQNLGLNSPALLMVVLAEN